VAQRLGYAVEAIKYEYLSYCISRGSVLDARNRQQLKHAQNIIYYMVEGPQQGPAENLETFGILVALLRLNPKVTIVVHDRLFQIYTEALLIHGCSYQSIIKFSDSGTLCDLRLNIATRLNSTILKYLLVDSVADIAAARKVGIKVKSKTKEFFRSTLDLPSIGITWSSSAKGKAKLPLEIWESLVASFRAHFVILQFLPKETDIQKLRLKAQISNSKIVDRRLSVPSGCLRDFAEEIQHLDLVVGSSSTVMRLAGAMNVKSILIDDGKFNRQWAVGENQEPWYPSIEKISVERASKRPQEFAHFVSDLLSANSSVG